MENENENTDIPEVAKLTLEEPAQEAVDATSKDIDLALECKEKGNQHFRLKEYDAAIEEFSRAISFCPELSEHQETKAIFWGNRAAAFWALEEFEQVVQDCSSSLELNPNYVKVVARRFQAYEKLGKVDEALVDAKKLKELDPSFPKIDETITRLEKACEERMAKLKDEALGKLKELGNSILGNFGLSLDNFKMTQDPNTGSWSVSMNNGGASK